MQIAFKKILEYKLLPRFMMFTMTVVYVRCIESVSYTHLTLPTICSV